ncbi:hypothetical protein ACO0RG_002447 [Hanseniaspora osmophila]|uniref:Suppressor of hydroxyurea sensitivity protein 2 n=1 Tax=Hanseniaspora osmophila TaxID=56408 RepID=A0A1E5RVW3_9ASCO|nr:Suppressor of hydroxyurea sensitivity protein 2 [Hanseniaspora osmophila]
MLLSRDFINYSEILSQLVNEENELNQDILAFCFNLFDSETFIKALSILESRNLFLYLFTPVPLLETNANQQETLLSSFYKNQNDSQYLKRIIIKENNEKDIVFVDLDSWYCGCEEHNRKYRDSMDDLSSLVEKKQELNTSQNKTMYFSQPPQEPEDFFAKIPASKQYDSSCKIMCPHLLAAAILLQSSMAVFQHFLTKKETCYIIKVESMDEWLRLQCNIVV